MRDNEPEIHFPEPDVAYDPLRFMLPEDQETLKTNTELLGAVEDLQDEYLKDIEAIKTRLFDPSQNKWVIVYARTESAESSIESYDEFPESALIAIAQDHAASDMLRSGYFEDSRLNPVDVFLELQFKEHPQEFEQLHIGILAHPIKKYVFLSVLEAILGVPYTGRKYQKSLDRHLERMQKEIKTIKDTYNVHSLDDIDSEYLPWDAINIAALEEAEQKRFAQWQPATSIFTESDKPIVRNNVGTRVVALLAFMGVTGGALATCTNTQTGTSNESQRTLPPLASTTFVPTTELVTTTTIDQCKQWPVKAGDTIFDIAAACGVTEDALKAANPAILNIDEIFPGQIIVIPDENTVFTLPSTTTIETTTVPATTVQPTTTPLPTTVPPTVPPPPSPTTTIPAVVNDGALSAELCAQYSGTVYEFKYGENLLEILQSVVGLTKSEAYAFYNNKEFLKRFKLEQITATYDKEGKRVSQRGECLPTAIEARKA